MKRKSKRIEDAKKKRRISSSCDSITEKESSSSESSDDEYNEDEDNLITYVTEDDILEQLKKTDRKTYDKFVEVKDVIDNSIPDITTITNEDISLNNKARIVELYEVFKLTEPLTEEWLLLKDRLNMLVLVYKEEYININSQISVKNKLVLVGGAVYQSGGAGHCRSSLDSYDDRRR